MIVVDTNTIAYLYLNSEFTESVEELMSKDAEWCAPVLWRSEFRNILAFHIRQGLLSLEVAISIQQAAERLLSGNEFNSDTSSVLSLAADSGCSAYDCEFVSLAKALHTRLLTFDKKLLKCFPEVAVSPEQLP